MSVTGGRSRSWIKVIRMEVRRCLLWEMIPWLTKVLDFKRVMDFAYRICIHGLSYYDSKFITDCHCGNWLKWIYCPNQKFKQYFECDKKTKSKVFADRVCDGAPDCPGHQEFYLWMTLICHVIVWNDQVVKIQNWTIFWMNRWECNAEKIQN